MAPRPEEPPWLVASGEGLEVWALEAYFGGSHQTFLEGLAAHSAHAFSLLTLPGRHWKWRMHGGALSLAQQAQESAASQRKPHVLFASSMVDLTSFVALCSPLACNVPRILYFHENQLTYPLPPGVERDLGYGVKQVVAALAADEVWFNSEFHRVEFMKGLVDLMGAVPDEAPVWAVEAIGRKSTVVPVGCDLRRLDEYRPKGSRANERSGRWGDPDRGPLIVWNQRWEYDKAPGDLFAGLYSLQEAGLPFRLALAGANQGVPSAVFVEAKERLAAHIVQWGRLESFPEYADLLWRADIVPSTALHEFFGVSVIEAVYCGCRPVLPDRLSYPEIVPPAAHGWALYPQGGFSDALSIAVREFLVNPERPSGRAEWQRTWVAPFDWGHLVLRYDQRIWNCWEAGPGTESKLGP